MRLIAVTMIATELLEALQHRRQKIFARFDEPRLLELIECLTNALLQLAIDRDGYSEQREHGTSAVAGGREHAMDRGAELIHLDLQRAGARWRIKKLLGLNTVPAANWFRSFSTQSAGPHTVRYQVANATLAKAKGTPARSARKLAA
jgi:hypothetical protein